MFHNPERHTPVTYNLPQDSVFKLSLLQTVTQLGTRLLTNGPLGDMPAPSLIHKVGPQLLTGRAEVPESVWETVRHPSFDKFKFR